MLPQHPVNFREALLCFFHLFIFIDALLFGLSRTLEGTHGQHILFVPNGIILLKLLYHRLDFLCCLPQTFFLAWRNG